MMATGSRFIALARLAMVRVLILVLLWQELLLPAGAAAEAADAAGSAPAPAATLPDDDPSDEESTETDDQEQAQLQRSPTITALVPNRAKVGTVVVIRGRRFDRRGPQYNMVRFAKQGGGQVMARVATVRPTRLRVIVPAEAATGRVSVATRRGTAISPTDFEVIVPTLTDFNPKSGPSGVSVTLTGTELKADTGDTTATFAGPNGTRVPAVVTLSSATEVRTTVPDGAVTGPIELTNASGRTQTGGPFTVTPRQDFKLTATPTAVSAVQNTTATYVMALTSEQPNLTAMAKLATTELPAGVKARFEPAQIAAGGNTTLTLDLSTSGMAPGVYPFRVTATARLDGRDTVREVMPSLTVLPAGQTTLSGRVLSADNEPILGATVSLDGQTATTDAAGNFVLTGITAGVDRAVMVDGRTASAPGRTYPVIAEPATIVAGQATIVPYAFRLPAIDIETEVPMVPGAETVVTNPRLPELKSMIPPDANLRNRDGTPVTRVSISMVPIDRTPAPLPPNLSTMMVYTNQPGGAISDIAMPVVYPNLAGLDPGTRVELYTFNHDAVVWERYGYGRVSANGRTIEPEIDPATGRPYGLRDFAWHFPASGPSGNPGGDPQSCPFNRGPNQVDFSTGIKIEEATDISFGGARGGLTLSRSYTSAVAGRGITGRFGIGTKDNYDIRLSGIFQAGGAGRVIGPDEGTGRPFNYIRTEADGTLVFASTEMTSQLGDVMRRLPDGSFEYRRKTGERMRFDAHGRLTARVDRNNNTTTLSYTGANLTQVTDPVGRSITFDYDGAGRIVGATDPIGRRWSYAYDGGLLAFVTDPLGNTTRYEYSGLKLTAVIDGRHNPVKRIEYDAGERVIKQTFADGGFEQYGYTLSGNTITAVTITDSLGRSLTKRFNAAGYVIEEIDALGQKSTIRRDMTTNLPLETSGPCGCVEARREFDERGNVTALTDELGQTMRMEYEPVFNNLIKLTDRLGRVTTFAYDERGNRTSEANTLNQTIRYTYDEFGQMVSMTDPLNHTWTTEYDRRGNVIARTDPLGNRSTMEYDGISRMIAMADPLGRRTSLTYDALSRVLTRTEPSTAVTKFTYDANGNPTSITDALGRTWTMEYDMKNRLVKETDPLKHATRRQYNTEDELTAVVSPSNRTTRYTYDPRGQQATMTDPRGSVVRYSYDRDGNLISLTDQRGNTTSFVYDGLDRVAETRNPLGYATTMEYDAEGNVTATVDRLGRRTSIAYDALNRPSRVEYVDAVVAYTYDAAGRRTRINDTQSGFIEWSYDDANRLLSETTPAGMVSYTYDAADERASMVVAGRLPVTYGYDAVGRLQTIAQGAETFIYSYDLLSRRTSLQRPNGVTTAYSYDEVNRLTELKHKNEAELLIEDFQYTYNANDEIASITSLFSLPKLPTEKTVSPSDAANRTPNFGNASYTFNTMGQTTSKIDATGTTNYAWDARDQLKQVTLPNSQIVVYGYDMLGRRISRIANGFITQFLYDGIDVVLDINRNGSKIDYLNNLFIDEKLRQSSTTNALYFVRDHLGSTSILTDVSGNIIERVQYDSFGQSAGSSLTHYNFTGREKDQLTRFIYYRARWYDPEQGRFLSEDPIGFRGSENFYTYVGNNPISYTDPFGLTSIREIPVLCLPSFYNFLSALAISISACMGTGTGKISLLINATLIIAGYPPIPPTRVDTTTCNEARAIAGEAYKIFRDCLKSCRPPGGLRGLINDIRGLLGGSSDPFVFIYIGPPEILIDPCKAYGLSCGGGGPPML